MGEREDIKIRYVCPKCGQTAIFGEHFCHPVKRAARRSAILFSRQNLVAMVAVILIFALVLGSTGNLLVACVGLLVMAGLWWLLFRNKSTGNGNRYHELIKMTRGDQILAERLVQAEQQRNPEMTREECIDRACNKLLNDRLR